MKRTCCAARSSIVGRGRAKYALEHDVWYIALDLDELAAVGALVAAAAAQQPRRSSRFVTPTTCPSRRRDLPRESARTCARVGH